MTLAAGERLGPYEVLEPIGHGGMGVVYKAFDPALNRMVALKVLPTEFLHDPSFAERFQREIRIWASLEHPSVVPVYMAGIENERPFLSMKFVPGGTLAERLTDGPLELERAFTILADVAVALDYAHARGIVHRDVKPANVLLGDDGRAYLSDFGIADIVSVERPETQPRGMAGTPRYMAPEQARGQSPDQRADVYSLGCMAYEMLTGSPPFGGRTPVDVIMRHMNEEPRPPRELAPTLTPAAETAILKAMAKDPARRWPQATPFVQALAGDIGTHGAHTISLPGLPGLAVTTAPARAMRRVWAPRWIAVLLVGLAVGAALLAGILRYTERLTSERTALLAAGSPDVLINGARRALDAGAYPEALGMADLALRLYPEHAGVRELRARVQRAWDAEKALQIWRPPTPAPPSP